MACFTSWLATLIGVLYVSIVVGVRPGSGLNATENASGQAERTTDCCCYNPPRDKTFKNYGSLNGDNCPLYKHGYRACLKGSNNGQPCSGGYKDKNDLFCDTYSVMDCFSKLVRGIAYIPSSNNNNGWKW
ncbi:unnamed protein product [Symbiodinium pilosum]|uniref:Uncharacterized protein n=1 Tax=Symbiodinium pilosum TaxID=2952 RepID=A0A812MAD2_SYMPI|nr:unnamed protein product [Symbiodinium pilosum]